MSLGAYLIASYFIAYGVTLLLGHNLYSAIGTALFPWLIAAVIAAADYWKGGKRPAYFKLAWATLAVLLLVLAYPVLRG